MKVVPIDEIEGYEIGEREAGTLRRVKLVLTSDNMKIHLGIFPPRALGSMHSHPGSEEIVYVVRGHGQVTSKEETKSYGPNTLVYIPSGLPHQYRNTADEEMVLFAVYSPPAELTPPKGLNMK